MSEPTIDYTGEYFAKAVQKRAAISFPVKATDMATAARFAAKKILELLPGFTKGTVVLVERKSDERWTWTLTRPA